MKKINTEKFSQIITKTFYIVFLTIKKSKNNITICYACSKKTHKKQLFLLLKFCDSIRNCKASNAFTLYKCIYWFTFDWLLETAILLHKAPGREQLHPRLLPCVGDGVDHGAYPPTRSWSWAAAPTLDSLRRRRRGPRRMSSNALLAQTTKCVKFVLQIKIAVSFMCALS